MEKINKEEIFTSLQRLLNKYIEATGETPKCIKMSSSTRLRFWRQMMLLPPLIYQKHSFPLVTGVKTLFGIPIKIDNSTKSYEIILQ